jgi:CheY-like chemotaxis protein
MQRGWQVQRKGISHGRTTKGRVMPRILAIEADPKRRILLAVLIREHVKAEILMADSVKAAIKILSRKVPDLIIAPTLLSPQDGDELMETIKQLSAAPYVQTLTVPALDLLAEQPSTDRRRFGLLGHVFKPVFDRRRVDLGPQYDRNILGTQIVDGLERARLARAEYESMAAHYEEIARQRQAALAEVAATHALVTREDRGVQSRILREAAAEDRRVAERKGRADVPWLSAIKLSWGDEVGLVNISSNGVLVETGSKFIPGSTTELHLSGPDTNLVVPVRFIRSEVARIDGLGVKYHAAAAFASELDLARSRRTAGPASPPQALAALLSSVLSDTTAGNDPAPARFARGLRQLVHARDVQIRTAPASSSAGRETLYFDIPGTDRSSAKLEVVFDRNYDVNASEFRLLKAAAWLAAAVLEFERPADQLDEEPDDRGLKLLTEKVA